MKKIFLLSTALLITVIYFKLKNNNEDSFSSDKFESYSQIKTPVKRVAPKPTSNPRKVVATPKSSQIRKIKKNTKQITPVLNEDRHAAQVDHEGKIYPRTVKVDEDMIVAYGDLIVGSTDDLEDYQSGDKILNIPPPDLWPNGNIPYEIDQDLDDPIQVEIIRRVTKDLNELAGLNFHQRKASEEHYVLFKRGGQHCYANVGFRLGVTQVSLSPRCAEKEIYHELFHVLGFFHEQNRPDRDDYIEVLWENIDEENWAQFEKFSTQSYPDSFQDLNSLPFEFNSIMLYDSRAFSNTTDYSMVRIDGTDFSIPFDRPTPTDVDRLKKLYPLKNK